VEFENRFSVNAPLDTVWQFITDVPQVAPCLPGAEITREIDPEHYEGAMKIKVGPVQMTMRGEIQVHIDEAEHAIHLSARGRDVRGIGSASGTITAAVTPGDGGTDVVITSKVDVTGRIAQFGRGIMQDVANRQTAQFAACLQEKLTSGAAAESGGLTQ